MVSLHQKRHELTLWAFYGFIFLVLAVVFGVITTPDAAHIVAVIAKGIWHFLVVAGQIVVESIHEIKAS